LDYPTASKKMDIAEIVNNRFLSRNHLRAYHKKLDEDPLSIIIVAVRIKDKMLAEELFETYPVQSVRTAIVLDNPDLLQRIIKMHSPFKHSDYLEIMEYLRNTDSPYRSHFEGVEVQQPDTVGASLIHTEEPTIMGRIKGWFGFN